MSHRFQFAGHVVLVLTTLLAAVGGGWPAPAFAAPAVSVHPGAPARPPAQEAPDAAAAESMIVQYAAKFVCTEALQPGQFWYGPAAPIVQQKTDVLVHNPNAIPVTLFKKAVIAPIENHPGPDQGTAPGKWVRARLGPDYAFRINCDDIAKLLTGKADATFSGTYGIGVTVEGFVVIGIGPQAVPGTTLSRVSQLDVTAEYVRSSEVMKKDVHYQPWWWWWWWQYPVLPWRLGYAYQRILPLAPSSAQYPNIDCRDLLVKALVRDTESMNDNGQREATVAALEQGSRIDPTSIAQQTEESPPALVPLIGRCDKLIVNNAPHVSVDYVLVSNKGPSDANPANGQVVTQVAVRYPWLPGRWYDLALVTPQNVNVDMDAYFRQWERQRWISAGAAAGAVDAALVYYFPYWCGWGYWYWWWNAGGCVDIGVGEGESLDVEQITPVRVFMPQWPPPTQ